MYNYKLTLNRNWSIGGLANGMPLNPLIGRPLYDRKYRPIIWLPLFKVIRKSSDVKQSTFPKINQIESKLAAARENILN